MFWKLNDDEKEDLGFQMTMINVKNIDVNIWVHNNWCLDIPCIHFQNNYEKKPDEFENLITLSIDDNKLLLNENEKLNINVNDINKIKHWTKLNKHLLLKLWNEEIDNVEFLDQMKDI